MFNIKRLALSLVVIANKNSKEAKDEFKEKTGFEYEHPKIFLYVVAVVFVVGVLYPVYNMMVSFLAFLHPAQIHNQSDGCLQSDLEFLESVSDYSVIFFIKRCKSKGGDILKLAEKKASDIEENMYKKSIVCLSSHSPCQYYAIGKCIGGYISLFEEGQRVGILRRAMEVRVNECDPSHPVYPR
jgi:hypothetical protein